MKVKKQILGNLGITKESTLSFIQDLLQLKINPDNLQKIQKFFDVHDNLILKH